MRGHLGLAAALMLVIMGKALAAGPERHGTLNLSVENDAVSRRDQHYTSGVRLAWTTPPDAVPNWIQNAAAVLPFFPSHGEMRATFALGQNMYTPEDIEVATPPADQRPYAGWLYGAAGLVADTGSRLDSVELSLGVVGPWSLAEETQTWVHSVTGSPRPRGWDTQLDNEPALLLTWQRSWRALYVHDLGGLQLDVTPHVGVALGNVFTYGNGGAMLRFGHGLPHDYGPPRIQPSLPGSGFFVPHDGFGWYAFAGVEARGVVHNIFLDGNTFGGRDTTIDKRILVGDVQLGVAVTLGDVRIAYTHVLRTPEFEQQSGLDHFGALSISTRF